MKKLIGFEGSSSRFYMREEQSDIPPENSLTLTRRHHKTGMDIPFRTQPNKKLYLL